MFGPGTLANELNKTSPIDANSPMVYALVRLAALLGDRVETEAAMDQLNAAGREFARAKEALSAMSFHKKNGMSLSIAEMAMQMTPEQWERWMGEIPKIAEMISRPNAQGMEGVLMRAVVETAKAAGMKQEAARALVLNANLTWSDDDKAQHTVTVNGGARYRRKGP